MSNAKLIIEKLNILEFKPCADCKTPEKCTKAGMCASDESFKPCGDCKTPEACTKAGKCASNEEFKACCDCKNEEKCKAAGKCLSDASESKIKDVMIEIEDMLMSKGATEEEAQLIYNDPKTSAMVAKMLTDKSSTSEIAKVLAKKIGLE